MNKTNNILTIALFAFLFFRKPAGAGIFGPIKAKTKFLPVYIEGKPNPALISANYKKPGVYIIKVNGKIRYIGYSASNVYKTLIRHFQSWEDRQQIRVTYPRASYVTGRVVYTNTGRQAEALEKALILKHQPEDNPNKYEQYKNDLFTNNILDSYQAAPLEDAPF
jgi:hypothetical protein